MPRSFWRSPDAVAQLNQLERAGFALEFLRRNPAYRHDYARTQRSIARRRVDPDEASDDLARRWGLRFRP
ncbi:MAG: DUF6499 domain-containing protein [Methylocystis sp.]